jgi:hypothetical protein
VLEICREKRPLPSICECLQGDGGVWRSGQSRKRAFAEGADKQSFSFLRDSLRAAIAIFFDELAANCLGAPQQATLGWPTVSGGHTRLRLGRSGNAGILAIADVHNAILTRGWQVRKYRGRVRFRFSLLMRVFRR